MTANEFLYKLLNEVSSKTNSKFTGLGLLVYDNLNHLPISPLKKFEHKILPITSYDDIVEELILISKSNSKYHDGFHLINHKLELTHISQYIAPPIIKNILIKNEYGSRYRTAIYSTLVSGVICGGVVSKNYPITIFEKGQEQ